jgi:glyoxylase-like metal-dependent hydrolase (beta-lactamase superfamily II)
MSLLRSLMIGAAAMLGGAAALAQPDTVRELTPGVFFHEGDFRRGHSNNGWIVFDEFVLVIDANFPSGAQVVIPKIKASTDKPIRLVLDTHHHGDHAYGNRVWADLGATIIAHQGVLQHMNESEPGGWNSTARNREDLRATSFMRPIVTYAKELVVEEGERRAEFHWFGIAHTRGDTFTWLPKEKILFTGDACVNGAFNYCGNATVAEWIKTLEVAKALGAEIVCPGHGPVGGPEIIVDQQQFFIELTKRVQALRTANQTPAEAKAAVPAMIEDMKKIPNIARYVGGGLEGQAEKVWTELGGAAFPK